MPCYVKYENGTQRAFVRHRHGEPFRLRAFGPKDPTHSTVGVPCPACGEPIRARAFTTLIPLGPGNSEEARERMRAGYWYNAAAIEAHWACVMGTEIRPAEANEEQTQ